MKKQILIILSLMVVALVSFGDTFSLTMENDVFGNTDRHYTHGTRFVYLWDSLSLEQNGMDSLASDLCIDTLFGEKFYSKDKENLLGLAIGQYMYTPSDISVPELLVDDRPYAGWLYCGLLFFAKDNNQQDMVEVDIGIVGPSAACEWTQTEVHKIIDSQIPQGWDNQIKDELGINVSYQRKYRYRYKNSADVIPSAGCSLGNVATYGSIGLSVRGGYNIPDDFGFLRIEPTLRDIRSDLRVYVFADIGARYVVHNIFLEGNTFRDSHSVEEEELVGDFAVGLGIGYKRAEILYAYNVRSKEFKGQEEHNEFGTISISYRF